MKKNDEVYFEDLDRIIQDIIIDLIVSIIETKRKNLKEEVDK